LIKDGIEEVLEKRYSARDVDPLKTEVQDLGPIYQPGGLQYQDEGVMLDY